MKPQKRIRVEAGTDAYGWCEFEFHGEPALSPVVNALFKAFSPKRSRQPDPDPGVTRYVAIVNRRTFNEANYRAALVRLAGQRPTATSQSLEQLETCRDLNTAVELLRSAFGIVMSHSLAAGLRGYTHTPQPILRAMLDDPDSNLIWVGYTANRKLGGRAPKEELNMDGITGLQSKHLDFEVSTLVEFCVWADLENDLVTPDESYAEDTLADMVSNVFNAIRDERLRVKLASRLLAGTALERVRGLIYVEPSKTLQ